MPKFACEFCESKVRVPDKFVGKRVKCPGCGQAITVPGESAPEGDGGLDLSLLDDSMSGGAEKAAPRKLRSIVIGCGACSKTIHIPENRINSVTPCPKCKTPLKVDVPPLPDTTGSTIDLKHLVLDPTGEPSLLHDSLSGGTIGGSMASLTSTGTGRGGSLAGASPGGSFTGNAQDQMQELRQLNDLKAEGSITDDEFRKRKAAIYAGGSGTSDAARKAMSRSASGASDKAIRVTSATIIPGPIKAMAAVGVIGLAGFLVWQYGISPALNDITSSTTLDSAQEKNAEQTAETRRAQRERDAARRAAQEESQAESEPEVVTWASRLPDVGPGAMEVAMVMPGVPGPAPEAPPASIFDDTDTQTAAMANNTRVGSSRNFSPDVADTNPRDAVPPRQPVPGAAPGATAKKGEIAFWDVLLPEGGNSRRFGRMTAMTKTLSDDEYSASVGVGIGPAVTGFDDTEFRKYQNDARQALINSIANDEEYTKFRPEIGNRPKRIGGNEYFEDMVMSDRRTHRVMILTCIQDGFAVMYWFEGPTRLYRAWQRDAIGNAVIE